MFNHIARSMLPLCVFPSSLHSLPFACMVKPDSRFIDEENPKHYKDTNFATFLDYVSSCEPKRKNFLESRKLS